MQGVQLSDLHGEVAVVIVCDYCDDGNIAVKGWHEYPVWAGWPLEDRYRVPCAISPPQVETVETEL